MAFSTRPALPVVGGRFVPTAPTYQKNKPLSSNHLNNDDVPESFVFSRSKDAFSLESNAKPQATKPRPKKPRVYKHLFRHYDDISFDSWLRCSDPEAFLESVGYTSSEIQALATSDSFWTLDVHDQLAPKIRFLVESLGGGTGQLAWKPDSPGATATIPEMEECSFNETDIPHTLRLDARTKDSIQLNFFATSLSLDRVLGPHHAYLTLSDLPHGPQLLSNPKLWQAFLLACQTNSFEKLCHEWEANFFPANQPWHHTPERIQAFEQSFAAGLIPASKHKPIDRDARFDGSPPNADSTKYLIPLLLSHGANAFETDTQGASPLHWAAGNGNLLGVQALLHSIMSERQTFSLDSPNDTLPSHFLRQQEQLVYEDDFKWDSPPNPLVVDILDDFREYKHGATPFHWACASIRADHQGTGFSKWI